MSVVQSSTLFDFSEINHATDTHNLHCLFKDSENVYLVCYLACQSSLYCRKLLLSIMAVHLYQCILISKW